MRQFKKENIYDQMTGADRDSATGDKASKHRHHSVFNTGGLPLRTSHKRQNTVG